MTIGGVKEEPGPVRDRRKAPCEESVLKIGV